MSSLELQALLHAVASGPGLALLARGMAKGLGQDPGAIWPATAEQEAGSAVAREPAAAVEVAQGPGESCVAREMQGKLAAVLTWGTGQRQCVLGWSQVILLRPLDGIHSRAPGCAASIAGASMGTRVAKAIHARLQGPLNLPWQPCCL